MKLLLNAITKFCLGLILCAGLLFLPAGSFVYYNGWLFMALLFIPILLLGTVMLFKAPELLSKRLDFKEKQKEQSGVVKGAACVFLLGFIIAGLDFRFSWSYVPTWAVIGASIILLVSYVLYAEVMRENAYLSRTVKVEEGQTVVDKGLYSIVRHPMYSVTVWLFLSIPVVLGSWWALICFLPYIPIIVIRIIFEERLLTADLAGYEDYKRRVKFRLIPFIW